MLFFLCCCYHFWRSSAVLIHFVWILATPPAPLKEWLTDNRVHSINSSMEWTTPRCGDQCTEWTLLSSTKFRGQRHTLTWKYLEASKIINFIFICRVINGFIDYRPKAYVWCLDDEQVTTDYILSLRLVTFQFFTRCCQSFILWLGLFGKSFSLWTLV